jgi:hypothetical protein
MPVPMAFSSGWLKFSPSLNLNKNEDFPKVSEQLGNLKKCKVISKTKPVFISA